MIWIFPSSLSVLRIITVVVYVVGYIITTQNNEVGNKFILLWPSIVKVN